MKPTKEQIEKFMEVKYNPFDELLRRQKTMMAHTVICFIMSLICSLMLIFVLIGWI